jgi:hypothetical protein
MNYMASGVRDDNNINNMIMPLVRKAVQYRSSKLSSWPAKEYVFLPHWHGVKRNRNYV